MPDTPFPMSSDLDQFFGNSPIPSVLLSADLLVLSCNAAYEQGMSPSRESVLSRPLAEVFAPGEPGLRDVLEMSLRHVQRHRQAHQISLVSCPSPMGDAPGSGYQGRYWSVTSTPLLNDAGEVERILFQAMDITELSRHARMPGTEGFAAALGTTNHQAEVHA